MSSQGAQFEQIRKLRIVMEDIFKLYVLKAVDKKPITLFEVVIRTSLLSLVVVQIFYSEHVTCVSDVSSTFIL